MCAQPFRDRIYRLWTRIVFDKEAPEFPSDKLRARGLAHQNVDDVISIEISRSVHERFRPAILLKRREPKLLRRHVDSITCERACGFANVLLGVIADPDREQFHQLARPVFIWM